jgi:hypothetical protein
MTIHLAPEQVVAFDKDNQPCLFDPKQWRLSLDRRRTTITCKAPDHTTTHYSLANDTLCCLVISQQEKTAVGRTLARMALTGYASRRIMQGTGVGGALMDLSLRGTETRNVVAAVLLLKDTTTIRLEGSEEELTDFMARIPQSAMSEEGIQEAEAFTDLVKRMTADGERILTEIDAKIVPWQRSETMSR